MQKKRGPHKTASKYGKEAADTEYTEKTEEQNGFFAMKLNSQQTAAVKAVDGAVLLLAVPGSGKTSVLTARLGYMITRRHIPAERILVLTFTVAAANEMKRRFEKYYGNETGTPEFRTINGLANKIILDFSAKTGYAPFTLMSDEKAVSRLLGEIYRAATGDFATEAVTAELKSRITRAKNSMLTDDKLALLDDSVIPFEKCFNAYRDYMKKNRLMDFDDQLVYAYNILNKYPSFRAEYSRKYKYVCVDEAQDTSKIQHKIIELIVGGNNNIFMVGDEDQSIYGFRGAAPEFLLNFEKNYPGATVLKSEENFRSVPEITSAAACFINRNTMRTEKTIRPHRSDSGKVREIKVFDIPSQYRVIAKLVEEQKDGSTTAVLFRNNECMLPLVDMMLEKNGDFSCRDTDCTFFTSPTVLDVTNILRLSANDRDAEAFMCVYYKLGLFITKAAAERAVAESGKNGSGILENIKASGSLSPQAKERCSKILNTLGRIRRENMPTAVFLAAHLPGYSGNDGVGAEEGKVEILQTLAENDKNTGDFLAHLARLRKTVKDGVRGSGRVVFSTVHSAKGLEFDNVYIISAVDGLFPSQIPDENRTREEQALFEEERRLFYVAATRAKNNLFIVTYKSDKYSSLFADEFLRRDRPLLRRTVNPVPKISGAGFTVDARSHTVFDSDDIGVGSEITHLNFGDGEVTAKNGDIITAEFRNGRVRRLSISHMRRKGLIKVR